MIESNNIVVYFSHKGNNYVNGKIVNLKKGNTEIVAEKIKNLINCDIFKIETVEDYPFDYYETTEVAKKELKLKSRPVIKSTITMNSYDNIFVGYPNWWGTMPMAMFTFLEENDFSGKNIIPFCTHEGSFMGGSENDLKRLCINSVIKEGLSIHGSKVKKSDKDIMRWLKKLGVI